MISRRSLIAAGAAALGGCTSSHRLKAARVSVVKAPAYNRDVYNLVRRLVESHNLDIRGKRVVLKPNLVEFDSGTVINTNPLVVHAAYETFRALGAADVCIAEGPGHRRTTYDMAEAAGYFAVVPGFERLFTDLNTDEVTAVKLATAHSSLKELHLPQTILGADLIVSLPKMKTHHWVGATLSMKNFFGVVPGSIYGWPKNVLHWAGIVECIADICNTMPPTFAIVDGIDGMEGNGPIRGTLKHAGVLVGGRHLPSVDATCCRLMGIDAGQIEYLQLVPPAAAIHQIAEAVEPLCTRFRMAPGFDKLALPA